MPGAPFVASQRSHPRGKGPGIRRVLRSYQALKALRPRGYEETDREAFLVSQADETGRVGRPQPMWA